MLSWQFSLLTKFEDQKLIFGGWVEESNGGKESNATSVFLSCTNLFNKEDILQMLKLLKIDWWVHHHKVMRAESTLILDSIVPVYPTHYNTSHFWGI